MKFLKSISFVMFLVVFLGDALAELKIVKREVVSSNFTDSENYAKLVSDTGQSYWITLEFQKMGLDRTTFLLHFEDFFDGGLPHSVELDENHAPLFGFGDVHQEGLLAWIPIAPALVKGKDDNRTLSLIKLNKAATKVEKYGNLMEMRFVDATIKIGDDYYISGSTIGEKGSFLEMKNRSPLLFKLNKDLNIQQGFKTFPKIVGGRLSSIFALKSGRFFATLGFYDGSEIWEFSTKLVPLQRIKLPGLGSVGIPLRDGGFILTYQLLPYRDEYIERFDSNGKSVWKKKIHTEMDSNMPRVLVELKDGFGLVTSNNEQLTVVRIDAGGKHVRVTKDTQSGLRAPYGLPVGKYLVGVKGDNIHVRGVAGNGDGISKYSFHFIESP